jgi:UDPglucose 6-dehydrogenase
MNIAVIGTDEIGLSTAILLAYMNHFVVVVDDNQGKVDLLKKNSLHFYEPHLNEAIKVVNSGLSFTTNLTKAIETSDIVYYTSNLGYSKMELCQIFAGSLKDKFRVLVNKTQDKLGTTAEMDGIIRQKSSSFSIAYEVPFANTGTLVSDTFFPEKMAIGTRDIMALQTLKTIYQPMVSQTVLLPDFIERPARPPGKVIWTDIPSAELAYHGEQVFKGLKTSFVNEINNLAEKYGANTEDILSVFRASGVNNLQLKYGLGWSRKEYGDNFTLLTEAASQAGIEVPLIKNALVSNYAQRDVLIDKISHALKGLEGKTIGILGLAYKPMTDSIVDSPAIDIVHVLLEHKARVRVHDPVCSIKMSMRYPELAVEYPPHVSDIFDGTDIVILCTEWSEYLTMDWRQLSQYMNKAIVFDARNCLPHKSLVGMGFEVLTFSGEAD